MQAVPNPILARAWRGEAVESVHRGVVVVMRGADVVRLVGDADAPQCLRSTAKPFQALAALEIILGAGFEMSDAEIAVVSSSHGGQPLHVALVRGLLARAGIAESELQCGAHAPMHGPSAAALVAAGEHPTALHNNCSGKHASMLIASRFLGAPRDRYLEPSHPLQQKNLATVARFAGVRPTDVGIAVDGCSAPTFVLSARSLATAYSNLVNPGPPGAGSPVWRRLMNAIPREPIAYSGEGRTCAKIITATRGAVCPKVGAEGIYSLGVPGAQLGIVTKLDDGSHRPTEALVATVLLALGVAFPDGSREALEAMRAAPIKNHRGLVVGRLEVALP